MTGSANGSRRKRNVMGAARVGARVNVEGVRLLVGEFNTLLSTLRQVRSELNQINTAAGQFQMPGGGGGGVGVGQSNPALSKFRGMQRNVAFSALGGFALTGMSMFADRYNRNLGESIPISQGNMYLSSQYGGLKYGTMERDRVKALGQFSMSRTEALGAQATALGFGMGAGQANAYLSQTVAPLVQASGGTITPTQAAGMGGTFLDPFTQRRASAMGVGLARTKGMVQNPLTTAMGYIKNFEQRMGIKFNSIDFENMRSPGSSMRYTMKRLYMLSDEAIDTIVQAGLQNATFQNIGGRGGQTIDFSNAENLRAIGMKNTRLGMKSFELMASSTNREARFFQKQEGSMVGKLQQDINIQETLADVEDAFSGLIGPLGEFQKYLKLAAGALAMFGGSGLLGMGGGGGGLVGLLRGGGGAVAAAGEAGAAAGAGQAAVGTAAASKFMGGRFAGMSGARIAGGAALIGGGIIMARNSGNYTASSLMGSGGVGAAGISGGAAMGGAMMLGMTGPQAALVGGAVAAYSAYKYFKGKDARAVEAGAQNALTQTDADLIKGINDYVSHSVNKDSKGNQIGSYGAGPKQRGWFDVWAMRRGALMSAFLSSANDSGLFDDKNLKMSGADAGKIADLINMLSSDKVKDDKAFFNKGREADMWIQKLRKTKTGRELYEKYFGNVSSPMAFEPINTDEANSLVLSNSDIISGNAGDGPYSKGVGNVGDAVSDKAEGKGSTWGNLDERMKSRLLQLFRASGGRVWLGNGWRSTEQQKNLFLSRYREDPNGEVSWNGKKWKHVSGAVAAPPGRSMHEIGLAADIEGDLGWLQENAGKFGLKTAANVNNEPWHVQPNELPWSRREYEKGGGASEGGSASSGGSPMAEGSISGGSVGGGVGASSDNANFSLAAAGPNGVSFGSTAASTTAGSIGGDTSAPSTGQLSAADVARVAYKAGFRGNDLVTAVAIAMRESGGNASAHNTNANTGDNSYGLWQINMLGSLGPARQKQFGINSYDDLLNADINARAAFMIYQGGGFNAWGGYKGMSNTANTDMGAAQKAVAEAGLGDAVFARAGAAMSGGGGSSGGVNVNLGGIVVHMNAKGTLQYDAQQLAAQAMAMIEEGVQMAVKRSE